MNPRDRFEVFTVAAAHKAIEHDSSIRAAVMFGPDKPLMTPDGSPRTRVRLFDRVGEADDFLRAFVEAREEEGWVKVWGALKYRAFEFERDDHSLFVAMQKKQ
jgi:hypothetical protein